MIFVDSSFWIGVVVERDDRHREAQTLLGTLRGETLVTSNAVRGESWTFVRSRFGHRVAVTLLDRLEQSPRLRVEFITREQEGEALRWLRRHDERRYSFVDATSFAVMRDLGISSAFAFDGDFAAAGFAELRAGDLS